MPPQVRLNGHDGTAPIEIDGCPGSAVTLSASGSTDPYGDKLSFRWWWYREASGLFAPSVKFSADAGEETSVTVDNTAAPTSFPSHQLQAHIILEARGEGAPQLTRYRRAIISVPCAGFGADVETCQVKPIPPAH